MAGDEDDLPLRCDAALLAAAPELLRALDAEAGSAWAMDRDGRIVFANRAWFVFARDNGSAALAAQSPLGTSLWTAVPGVLLPFYDTALRRVFASGHPWQHEYECSSPLSRRRFVMRVVPLPGRDLAVVTNALVDERPATLVAVHATGCYRDASGIISQCAHCRRVRRIGPREEWDWVPALVARPAAKISHGLCATCLELHYGGLLAGAVG